MNRYYMRNKKIKSSLFFNRTHHFFIFLISLSIVIYFISQKQIKNAFAIKGTLNVNNTTSSLRFVGGTVDSLGRMGIGTTNPTATLEVAGNIKLNAAAPATTNGLCHSGSNSNTTFTGRNIVACSGSPSDIAEWYETDNAESGDIVATSDKTITYTSPSVNAMTGEVLDQKESITISVLTKSTKQYQPSIIGVVSTSPYQSFGRGVINHAENPNPVALIGRTPVKVSSINGPIRPGDPITSSDIPGIGMKATQPGPIVGIALESFDNPDPQVIGKIVIFANTSWHDPSTLTR